MGTVRPGDRLISMHGHVKIQHLCRRPRLIRSYHPQHQRRCWGPVRNTRGHMGIRRNRTGGAVTHPENATASVKMPNNLTMISSP